MNRISRLTTTVLVSGGLGVAIACPGVAVAEPSDPSAAASTSTDSSADASSSATGSPSDSASSPSSTSSGATHTSSAATEDESAEQESSISDDDAITDDDAISDDETTVDDESTVDEDAVRTETPPTTTDPQTDEDPAAAAPELTHGSDYEPNFVVSAATTDSPSHDPDAPTPDAFIPTAANAGAAQEPSTMVSMATARSTVTASADSAAMLTTTDKALLPAAQTPSGPAGPLDMVTTFVSEMLAWVGLGPSMSTAPAAPAAQPFLWGLLAWARREIQRTFFNRTPTISYNPVENSQTVTDDGLVTSVTGDLVAVDADGDPLRFSVVQAPGDGSVRINPDGTFVYTPGRELAALGGTDVFVVKVADEGFHLHGLLGLFKPDFGRSATATIEIAVTATCPAGCQVNPIKVIGTIEVGDGPDGVAFSQDGSHAYVTNALDNTVSVINTETGVVTSTIAVGNHPRDVVFNPQANRAYVTNLLDGTVSVINTLNNTVVATIPVGLHAERLAVSPGGTRLYVVASQNSGSTMTVIDATTNTVISSATLNGHPYDVAVTPNGVRVFVTTQIDWLDVVEILNNGVTHVDTNAGWMRGIAFSPQGTRVYIANSDLGTVSVLNANTYALIDTINVGAEPHGVAVNPAGTRVLVVNNADGTVSVISTATNNVIKTLDVGFLPNEVAISPDGTRAYVTNAGSDTVTVITLV